MANPDSRRMLAIAVAAAEDKKAEDLRVLKLDPAESGLTDYFLLMSGTNPRQIQTIADEIEFQLKRQMGEMPNSREGYKQAEWVLLDYVDFVVHIFSREKRDFYGLERLRKTATAVLPEELRAALADRTSASRSAKKATPARKSTRKKVASPVKEAVAAAKPRRGAKKAAKAPAKTAAKKRSRKN